MASIMKSPITFHWDLKIRTRDIIDGLFYAIILWFVLLVYKHDVNLYNDQLVACLKRQMLLIRNDTGNFPICFNTTKMLNGTAYINPMDITHESTCDLSVAKPP
jgi:hypothetical protein